MYKHYFGVAAIILSLGFLLRSVPDSQAHSLPTGMSSNGIAYESFTGTIAEYTNAVILAVPGDRAFIVTTTIFDDYGRGVDINEDSTVKVLGYSEATVVRYGDVAASTALTMGNGHIAFSPGTQIRLNNTGGTASDYYIEGYYAAP